MKINVYGLLVAVAFSAISNWAFAVEIRGFPSCETWLKKGSARPYRTMTNEFWVLGYLSGKASGLDKDFLKGTDNETIYHWVDNYCRAYPTKDVDDAARELDGAGFGSLMHRVLEEWGNDNQTRHCRDADSLAAHLKARLDAYAATIVPGARPAVRLRGPRSHRAAVAQAVSAVAPGLPKGGACPREPCFATAAC